MGQTLRGEEKLRKRAEFERLSGSRNKIHTQHFIVIWAVEGGGRPRIGITASRKVGNAVARNRVKRLIREFFRLRKSLFIDADFNIIAKRGADNLGYDEVSKELEKAILCIRKPK